MEFRVLRYFLTVAREGSITAAANSLHLTQPTLSRQLQDLERELGQKLLVRGKYKVSLTPEGMILRKRAEEIVDMVEKTEAEFQSIKDVVGGDIYIGCGETDSMRHVAEVMKEIQQIHSDIKFHIYSGNAEDVTEKLDKGLLDFGVLIQPIDLSKYDHIALPQKDVWGVIMRKDSPLAQKDVIEFKDLVKLVELFGVTSDYLLGLSDSPGKYAYPPFNDNKEEYVGEMFKQLDEGNQDATVDFIENRLDNQHISKEIREKDHRKRIVKQDKLPTKRVSIYARADAQGFELSEVPVDCLDYPVPIPVHDIAFKVVGESLETSFFDDEVIFIIKDSILRTGDISIVQLDSRYYVMKVSQNRENGDILLNSLNSNEAPITLSEKDDFSIFGKIVLM